MTAINVTLAIGINDGWLKKFAMKGAVKNSRAYNPMEMARLTKKTEFNMRKNKLQEHSKRYLHIF